MVNLRAPNIVYLDKTFLQNHLLAQVGRYYSGKQRPRVLNSVVSCCPADGRMQRGKEPVHRRRAVGLSAVSLNHLHSHLGWAILDILETPSKNP